MIAKRIARDKATSNFARLGRYVVDAEGGIDPSTWTRTADYILDTANDGAKVGGVRVTNCMNDDVAAAVQEILHTQDANTRSKSDKSYHLVFSFPAGERPSLKTLHAIEDHLVAAIGLSAHQRISAVHTDTDNLHVHVAINKVHPQTHVNVEPYYDKQRLMAACVEMEQRFGLQATPHGEQAERSVHGRPGDMEAHAGRDSLLGWVQREVVPALPALSDWQSLHRALARSALTIKPSGAGLAIASQDGTTIKASQVGRAFSKAALEARLGAYEPPAASIGRVQATKTYRQAPRQAHNSTATLFAQFQAARAAAVTARNAARTKLTGDHAKYAEQLGVWYQKRRLALKSGPTRGLTRKLEALALTRERNQSLKNQRQLAGEQLAATLASHPLPTWQQWLTEQANAGDVAALSVLRTRDQRTARFTADWVRASTVDEAKSIILQTATRQTDKHGRVSYRVQDGGQIRDERNGIRVQTRSDAAALLALTLAAERFAGQALIVDGSDAFKRQLAEAAAKHGINVTFADPSLQSIKAAHAPTTTSAGRAQPSPSQPDPIAMFVAERNEQRALTNTIVHHKSWAAPDAGTLVYQGRRHLAGGVEAVLLQRGDTMYVMPVTPAQAAKASTIRVGSTVTIDNRGRFLGQRRDRQS